MIKLYAVLIFALMIPFGAYPQSNLSYYLPATVSYNSKIPTPAALLGYEAGEWHVSHDQLVLYMKNRHVIQNTLQH